MTDDAASTTPRRLEGRTCVVTGAASAIGRAVAERFAAEGGTVVGVDVQEHDAGDLALVADLRDEDEVRRLYADVRERFGSLRVIYNNVGLMDRADGSALAVELPTWQRVLETNLTSTYLSCKHGIPLVRDSGGGSVVNAASFLAGIGAATAPMAYSASKAAVVQLSRDLGVHLARSGVRVTSVSFGPIETAAQRAVFDRTPGSLDKRLVHWPTGRFGTLEEAAATIAFLASDDAGFLTATDIQLDGGIANAFTVPD